MVVPRTHMKYNKMKDLNYNSFVRECPASLLVSLYCISTDLFKCGNRGPL